MSAAWSEKRRHPRRVFTTTVQYTVDSVPVEDVAKAVTVNISQSGVCLYTFCDHQAGDTLKIHNGVPYDLQSTAIVRWTRRVNEQLFKIGCEFESKIQL